MSAPTSKENLIVKAYKLNANPVASAKTMAIIRLNVYFLEISSNSSSDLSVFLSSPLPDEPPTPTRATHRRIKVTPRPSNFVTFCPYLQKNIITVKMQLVAKILEIIPALTPLGKAYAKVLMIKTIIVPWARALMIGTESLSPLNMTITFGYFLTTAPPFLSAYYISLSKLSIDSSSFLFPAGTSSSSPSTSNSS